MTPQNFLLLTAIKNGYIGRVQGLLDQGHSPNGGFDESNPLYVAIQKGKLEIVSLLIDRGADLNTPIEQSKNLTALHVAVMRGNKDIVTKILQQGAEWKTTDDEGATVLHLAMDPSQLIIDEIKKEDKIIDVLKIFLDLGASVEAKTLKGETPLFVAGKYRLQKVVEFLMERGADLNTRDDEGNSLIHWLVKDLNHIRQDRCSKEIMIQWLLSKSANANCANLAGETPLLLAARQMSRDVIQYLLNHVEDLPGFRDDRNRTILHVVLELSVRKPWEDNRLAHNSQSDPEEPEPAKVGKVEKMIEFLLDKGLSVDDVDDEGNTAFHVAVQRKKWFAVSKLLTKFTNVNARNKRGQTPLHIMIDFCDPYQKGYFDAVTALVAKAADIEAKDNEGLSPVQLAAKNKHERILNLFVEKGADLKIRTNRGETLLHLNVGNADYRRGWSCRTGMVKMLIDEGHCDVNAKTVDGVTPLQAALEAGNKDVVKTLLDRGADVNVREERSGTTPILMAARRYNREAIEALIKAGADVNAEDARGKTALHYVVEHKSDCVRSLIRAGAQCDALDGYGYTPLYYALKLDNFEAMALLLEVGADLEAIDVGREWWRLKECRPIRRCLAKLAHARVPIAEGFGLPSGYVQDEGIEARFHHDCRSEVAKMKTVEVGDGKTLYDFVRLGVDRRIGWLSCEKLEETVEWSSLEKSFPMYCDVVRGRYLRTVERKRLLANGRDALGRIVGFQMPDICVDNIFGRLSTKSLTMMVRGVGFREMEGEGDERPAKRQRME